jgi:hypothetical protein
MENTSNHTSQVLMKWFLNIKDFEIKQNIFKAFTKLELQNKYTKIISKNWRFKVCSTKRMIKRKKKPYYNSLKAASRPNQLIKGNISRLSISN